jgi:organic radical activating enzyme
MRKRKQFPYKYQNGPVSVTIEADGTKIREWDDEKYGLEPKLDFPESIDSKITASCDLCCEFCHEKSTPDGKHADLHKFAEMLDKSNWPAGIEMAVGGGNPLAHPHIDEFLEFCDEKEWLINMTVNFKHILSNQLHDHLIHHTYKDYLYHCFELGYIQGLGLSIDPKLMYKHIDKVAELAVKSNNNLVLHIIEGIHSYHETLNTLNAYICYCVMHDIKVTPKVLILGKKNFGRYKDIPKEQQEKDEAESKVWKTMIFKFMQFISRAGGVVSFDNLAIERLGVLSHLSEEEKRARYLGAEGTHTMYIDCVKEEYAINSTATKRFPIGDKKLRTIFKDIYKKRKELMP